MGKCTKVTLNLRSADLAEVVTSVPDGVVGPDHRGPVVEGTEPHLSVSVISREEQSNT